MTLGMGTGTRAVYLMIVYMIYEIRKAGSIERLNQK
jgi:hypothetical protein